MRASRRERPARRCTLAKSTRRIAFLVTSPISRMPETPTSESGKEKHQCERLQKAAELRSKNGIDEHDGEAQRLHGVPEAFDHDLGIAGIIDTVSGCDRQSGRARLDVIDDFAERAIYRAGADADLA